MATTAQQSDAMGALSEASDAIESDLNPDRFDGFSTCGFASITGIDGRRSFVRQIKEQFEEQNGRYQIELDGLELVMHSAHDSGYTLSIVNDREFISGAEYQRLDYQQRIHEILLGVLKDNDLAQGARIKTRMD